MKVIIAGTRDLKDAPNLVGRAIKESGFRISEVVTGCSGNVDGSGQLWAAFAGVPIKKFPADWKTYGRAAGPMRNEDMARYADALILVWDGKSKGSSSMLVEARVHGLKIHILQVPR